MFVYGISRHYGTWRQSLMWSGALNFVAQTKGSGFVFVPGYEAANTKDDFFTWTRCSLKAPKKSIFLNLPRPNTKRISLISFWCLEPSPRRALRVLCILRIDFDKYVFHLTCLAPVSSTWSYKKPQDVTSILISPAVTNSTAIHRGAPWQIHCSISGVCPSSGTTPLFVGLPWY